MPFMTRAATTALAALTLTACTGSGGGETDTTIPARAETGFATATDEIAPSILFRSNGDGRITVTSSAATAETVPIFVEFRSGDTLSGDPSDLAQMFINLDGEARLLTRVDPMTDRYIISLGGMETSAEFEVAQSATGAGGTILQSGLLKFDNADDPDNSRSYIVYGFDTDPDYVGAETGSFVYAGNINLIGYSDGDYATTDGMITFNVDFDDPNGLTGSFNHGTLTGMLNAQTYNLVGGTISGNTVRATLAPQNAFQTGETFGSGSLRGNFFGAGAEAIGGTVAFDVQEAADDEVLVQGGFVATR